MIHRFLGALCDRPANLTFAGFCCALLISLFELSQGIGQSLEGPHDFRQAQTALTTYYLGQNGLTLNYETPVLGSPASIPFEFPTYQFTVVAVHKLLGVRLDVAGRVTSIAYFYLTLPLVVLVLRRLRLPWAAIWLGLSALLVAPVYIFYTRAFLIESTALFTSWAFLAVTGVVILQTPGDASTASAARLRRACLFLALVVGCLAAVTKITTFAIHAAAAIWLWLAFHGEKWKQLKTDAALRRGLTKQALWLGGTLAAVLAVAIGWTHHTDAMKLSNPSPFAERLTSTALAGWNFGYLGQWMKPATWRGLYDHFLTASVASFFPIGLTAVLGSMIRSHRPLLAGLLLAFVTGPAVFTNLFFVHDYYWYANTVFLSLACGVTLGLFLLEHLASFRATKLVLVGVFILAQAAAYHYSGYHFIQKSPPRQTTQVAAAVGQHTREGSSIVIFGYDWNSMIPYYSERRAFMVPWDNELYFDPGSQKAIANMTTAGHPVGAVIFGGDSATDPELQHRVLATLPGRFTSVYQQAGVLIWARDFTDSVGIAAPASHP